MKKGASTCWQGTSSSTPTRSCNRAFWPRVKFSTNKSSVSTKQGNLLPKCPLMRTSKERWDKRMAFTSTWTWGPPPPERGKSSAEPSSAHLVTGSVQSPLTWEMAKRCAYQDLLSPSSRSLDLPPSNRTPMTKGLTKFQSMMRTVPGLSTG